MGEFKLTDEKTHPSGTHKYWNESFYMNFSNSDGTWGGATRIAFSPNQGFADGFICMYFPNGATGFIRTWENCPDHLERNSALNIEHRCVEPFKNWKVSYKGPIFYFENPAVMGDFMRTMLVDVPRKQIELELEFNALHDVLDFHDSMKREFISLREFLRKLKPGYFLNHIGPGLRKLGLLRIMSGAQHYEHAGKIEGKINVNGESHTISGFGQRDHSWGVRDMRVPTNWRWFSGQFGSDLCFNAIKVEILAFRASGGYVYHSGKAEAIKDWSLAAELENTGKWAKSVSLAIETDSGKNFHIEGEALANIPVSVTTGGYVS